MTSRIFEEHCKIPQFPSTDRCRFFVAVEKKGASSIASRYLGNMDLLPDTLRREWRTAIGREGSNAIEKAGLNICRAIGEELRTMQTGTAERQLRLEVFVKCVQTILFTYGERMVATSDGDTSLTRDYSRDFNAAVLSVYLDILALQATAFDKANLDAIANHFASQVNLYLKDSVLHMMDVFLQSEQVSLLVDREELIAPSIKLMASNLPAKPSLWEYARAIVLVHRLKLTSTKSADFHRALKRAHIPEDAQQFFASTLGSIEQTNNNEGDLTRHLLTAGISVDDCERIIEALTSATESSEYSSAAVSVVDSADESPMDDMIIDRGPVEEMDDDAPEINPVVDSRDCETVLIEADTTVSTESSTPSRGSMSKAPTSRHSKRKFASISPGEQEVQSISRRTSAPLSSPIGCVDVIENDRTTSVAHTAVETNSPTRRSRRISHLSGSPVVEAENRTDVVEPSIKAVALKKAAEQNESVDADETSDASGDGHDDEEEENGTGIRVRTAPSSIGRRTTGRPADKGSRLRVSVPTAKTASGEPTPPIKMRLRSNMSGTVDLSKTPVMAPTALKKAKTAKAGKATTTVGPSKTEPRMTRRTAKTPKH